MVAAFVRLVQIITSAGAVPLCFLGMALTILGILGVQKIQEHWRRARSTPSISSIQSPPPTVAEGLAMHYDESERLREELSIATHELVAGASGTTLKRVELEGKTRAWDRQVAALLSNGDRKKWELCAQLPLKPNVHGLVAFLEAKRRCLKESVAI